MAKDKDDLLATAKKRFELALENDEHNRVRAKQDIRFAAASPDDPWQWEDGDVQKRKLHKRPMLTINKLPQHIRQVTNDIRQNRPSIKYRPADNHSDVEVADILMGLARHIEANSDADVAYDFAAENQVTHGLGYIRVISDYISENSFDQDIYIKPIQDSFKCYDDPEAKDPAGADRKWFFIEDSLTKEDFEKQYPKAEAIDWKSNSAGDWFSNEKVRICEYFELTYKSKTLNQWGNGSSSFDGDKLPEGVSQGEMPIKTRSSQKCVVMWYKLNGQEILEQREFPCKYIPIARVFGNTWMVDGKMYVSGIVRNAKDSQRMYNVAQSAIVERVMLAPKAPYIGSIEAIEGYENVWRTANSEDHAILPYNALDGEGNQLDKPERVSPAQVEAGLSQIAASSSEDIKNETGQYDASLGQKSNETSGRAIMARQREGDTATYHYVDNLARAVRHIGRIILDMIPQVYDSRRVARILGEDGSPANAVIDTEHPEALTEMEDENGEITRIFNPTIGTYDVHTTTGPSFSTRRVEAVEAMTAMTQANPDLWSVIGDQLVKNMDWPGAEDMAERLKLTLRPEVQASIKDKSGKPDPAQLQQQLQQQGQQLEELGGALEDSMSQIETLKSENENLKIDKDIKIREIELKENVATANANKTEPDPNAVDQTQIAIAKINANSARELKLLELASNLIQSQEAKESPQKEAGEPVNEDVTETVDIQGQLAAQMQALQMIAETLAQPKTSIIQIQSPNGGVYTGQRIEQ